VSFYRGYRARKELSSLKPMPPESLATPSKAQTPPWSNQNILEIEKELKWRQLQNEKRKEVILSAVVKVLRVLAALRISRGT